MARYFNRNVVRAAISYGVAGACLYWVFHNVNLHEMLHSFGNVNWPLIAPAIILNVSVYLLAGWEWRILLRPMGCVSVLRATQAVFAGRFANDVLPVHMGYAIRIYLVSRWMRKEVQDVAPSLLVERLLDGVWLALGIGLATLFVPLPSKIARLAEVWAGIIAAGVMIGGFMVLRSSTMRVGPGRKVSRWKWVAKAISMAGRVSDEVRAIGRSWVLPGAFGVSFLKFATQGFAFLLILWAYGFDLSLRAQLVVFIVAYAGMSMPSTPASAGVFQLFCVSALGLFGVPKPAAAAFALLAFAAMTLPLSIAGFFAFAQSGATWRDVHLRARLLKGGAEGHRAV